MPELDKKKLVKFLMHKIRYYEKYDVANINDDYMYFSGKYHECLKIFELIEEGQFDKEIENVDKN